MPWLVRLLGRYPQRLAKYSCGGAYEPAAPTSGTHHQQAGACQRECTDSRSAMIVLESLLQAKGPASAVRSYGEAQTHFSRRGESKCPDCAAGRAEFNVGSKLTPGFGTTITSGGAGSVRGSGNKSFSDSPLSV